MQYFLKSPYTAKRDGMSSELCGRKLIENGEAALSFCIYGLCCIEDGVSADMVPAVFKAAPAYQIHITAEKLLEIGFHMDKVKKCVFRIIMKGDKNIYIAVLIEGFGKH